MDEPGFSGFPTSFGLIKGSCEKVVECFVKWQREVLLPCGFEIDVEVRNGRLDEALNELFPRTAPITTKFLFWPLGEGWVLYFENGVNGADAGPPIVISSRLKTDGLRVVVAGEVVNPVSGLVEQYHAVILEYYSNGIERRHIFVVNDGGKWKFGESGEAFPFESTSVYGSRKIRDRFTRSMLFDYLGGLGVDLRGAYSPLASGVDGYLVKKRGKMPLSYREFAC